MRNRIDITEVEAGTKIRAKYLRALENEEWDLLPGPTFVKTFLRSYADYLGLDSRQLVEEYKQRFERPSTMELTPFARGPGGRREQRRRSRAWLGPALAVVLGLVAGPRRALRARAAGATTTSAPAPTTAATPTATPRQKGQEARSQRPRRSACHPPDRAHRDRQRLPRRRHRQDADQQPGPAGRPATRSATAASASASSFGNGQARLKARPHDRRARPLDQPSATTCGPASARASCRRRGGPPARERRAGILVTGTEVLSGIISDRNGPWLSERLREHGVELAEIVIVGDRPEDLLAALRLHVARRRPGRHQRRPRADRRRPDRRGRGGVHRARRWRSTRRWRSGSGRSSSACAAAGATSTRTRSAPPTASRRSCRTGATVLEPVGHRARPRRRRGRRLVLVLPGPPRELQPMWETALETGRCWRAAGAGGHLRAAHHAPVRDPGVGDRRARCARSRPTASRSSSSRSPPACAAARSRSRPCSSRRRADVYDALRGRDPRAPRRHAVLRGRLDGRRPGDRAAAGRAHGGRGRVLHGRADGGAADRARRLLRRTCWAALVVYSNEAKTALAGVPAELIEAHGAVSPEVAAALADGARARFGAEIGIGITGIAGPGGGTRGEAGRDGLPERRRSVTSAGTAPCSSPATARRSASAPRPS